MAITNWPSNERPREKLLEKGAAALSDAELLAIFLRTGFQRITAVDLARRLLLQFGGLHALMNASATQLCQQPGLGSAKYAQLHAALELGKRYLQYQLQTQDLLENSADTRQFVSLKLRPYGHEVFACLFLTARFQLICFEELFHGTLDYAQIYPRELIKKSLFHNAAAIILAHNHPSGPAQPSRADKQVTEHLKKACAFVNIQLLDHIIVGAGEVTSFTELGLL